MLPFPSPDPSASLSPWQTYEVAGASWFASQATLVVFAVVLGLGFLIFTAALVAGAVGWRR